jgi:hypothetical protein
VPKQNAASGEKFTMICVCFADLARSCVCLTSSLHPRAMCNLYSMAHSREAIARLFRLKDNRIGEIKPQTSIFPGYSAPVFRNASDGDRELVTMSWGFVLLQSGRCFVDAYRAVWNNERRPCGSVNRHVWLLYASCKTRTLNGSHGRCLYSSQWI